MAVYNLACMWRVHKGKQQKVHTLNWESQGADATGQDGTGLGLGQAQEVLVGQAPVWEVHVACSSKASLFGTLHQHLSFCIICMSTLTLSLAQPDAAAGQ